MPERDNRAIELRRGLPRVSEGLNFFANEPFGTHVRNFRALLDGASSPFPRGYYQDLDRDVEVLLTIIAKKRVNPIEWQPFLDNPHYSMPRERIKRSYNGDINKAKLRELVPFLEAYFDNAQERWDSYVRSELPSPVFDEYGYFTGVTGVNREALPLTFDSWKKWEARKIAQPLDP